MRIEQLMTTPVHSCKPEDTLERAAQLMWDRDCGASRREISSSKFPEGSARTTSPAHGIPLKSRCSAAEH